MSLELQKRLLWVVRLGLVVALIITIAFPNWEQFAGKGMAFRAPFYLLPVAVVPLIWKLRGSNSPYPYLVDALVVAPFLVDTLGNVGNFYNNFNATDDVLHFLNWVLLMGGVTLALARTGIGKLNAWSLGWGFGGLAIIWWEAAEFLVQELGTAGLSLTYEDTIGDLLLSSTGGAVGSALAIWLGWGHPKATGSPPR
ncbi:MAG: hypothetical protein ACI8TP_003772 [Acidimicrobiales bacterium]|jgi:hypothetical protein